MSCVKAVGDRECKVERSANLAKARIVEMSDTLVFGMVLSLYRVDGSNAPLILEGNNSGRDDSLSGKGDVAVIENYGLGCPIAMSGDRIIGYFRLSDRRFPAVVSI
ncbi:hypothetical protein OUZ56_012177 [Daphnia magna]|uniref:Uncharacterized protein n=1 Tax=Daphnia magna TaxID=35525 RepID=A0ABQ9Z292_9CRUS|nr:hypothetical protein OUZ56_012177 [Daphnia magna]